MNALFEKREEAAQAVAQAVAISLRNLIASQGRAVFLVDCTSRPLEFLTALTREEGIDWTQVIIFQASEFVGEGPDSPASCQQFLTEHFISRVPIVTFHQMRGDAPNQSAAVRNLSERLDRTPADVAFLGGEVYSTLSALEGLNANIARLQVSDQLTLSFTLTALERCSLFVFGEASGFAVRETTEPGAQAFLFTNR